MADNKKMIKNLFSAMQDALFLGDRFSNGEFVSFLQPGQFVSTELEENGHSDDMAIQSEIANILVDSSYVNTYKDVEYSSGTELLGSVDQVYYDILQHSALPHQELVEAVRQEIETLEIWMTNNQSSYDLYENLYLDSVSAYETERCSQNPRPGMLEVLLQKKKSGYNKWETYGRKATHESKKARHLYLTSENPTTFWAMLREKMRLQKQNSTKFGEYYQTFLIPSISSWNNSSWATFESEVAESDIYEHSKSTSWSGGLRGGWGLWSWGGGTSGSTNYQHNKSSVSTVKLKFDYLRVRIHRNWMVDDVFHYDFWTWKKEFGGKLLSDGGNLNQNPPVRPIGRMPILPQYLIVVKNVEISAAFSEEEKEFYSKQVNYKASVGWGPFKVNGSYQSRTETRHITASFDGITFKINHPQIIARSGIMLAKSPNPNKNLPWQGDEWIPENDNNLFKELKEIRDKDYEQLLKNEKIDELEREVDKVKETFQLNNIDELL